MQTGRIAITLLASILIVIPTAWAEDPVYFADTGLKQAVMNTLGLTTDPTPIDMLNLYELISADGIADLTGLEHASNLWRIYLAGHGVTDLRPIGGLTNLAFVSLISGPLVDISPLSGLPNLTGVGMPGNRIVDISCLSRQTKITSLSLSNNQISDLRPLSGLTNLTWLEIEGNPITDLSGLNGLSRLEGLSISGQLSDLGPLSGLTALRGLFAADSGITDVSPLSTLTNLTGLHLGGNHISDISALSAMTQLQGLHLECNYQISDISPLANLRNLHYLRMEYNQVTSLIPLSGLTNLSELYAGANQITDISPLSGLLNLWSLGLYDNQITDISPLLNMTMLRELDLARNPLDQAAYCTHIPAIESNNPGLVVGADPNPYNCGPEGTPTPEGANVVVNPLDDTTGTTPVTLTFEQVTTAGGTTLATSASGPTPPSGFQVGNPATYYSITTTASYTGLIEVCISYADISFSGAPKRLRLFHYEDGQWVDCTTGVNTTSKTVCGMVTSFSPFTVLEPTFIEVNIDIKPGSYPNSINKNGNGVVPVAILGSEHLDVQEIEPLTLQLNGLPVRVKGNGVTQCAVEDVNQDGYADLVCQFVDDASAWLEGSATAILTGNLKAESGGTRIEGSDEIRIVP